jgi:hypothetical protein
MKNTTILLAVLLTLFGFWLFFLTEPLLEAQEQEVNTTWTVNTTVNITNAAPFITSIALDTPIDLTAYNTTQVYCNVTTRDYDNDTVLVNATLYLEGVAEADAPDSGVDHYTNASCTNITVQDESINWTCVFDVQYYAANASTWRCNVTAIDTISQFPTSNISGLSIVNTLLAIKMPAIMDYGDLVTGQTSNDTTGNITNAGNRDVNISVYGYANTPSDGLAFVCTTGSIPLSYERYNISANSSFPLMTQLTSTATNISDFYVPRRASDASESINLTYWQVQIPVGAAGVCNGKIVFTASERIGT